MRATIIRVWDVLSAGRPVHSVAIRFAGALSLATVLWACICMFLMLEPARTATARQRAASTANAPQVCEAARAASYAFLAPLNGRFDREESHHG